MKHRTAAEAGLGIFRSALVCAALASSMAPQAAAGLFSGREIPAAWNDSKIKVDGSDLEWDPEAVTERDGLALSAANDDKYLYVRITALGRDSAGQLSGMFRQTFTLWLDGGGGKKKSYGVRLTAKVPPAKEESASVPGDTSGEKRGPEAKAAVYTAVILSSGGVNSPETDGVEFKAGLNRRKRPVFEFKVPLAAVLAKAGPLVGLGVETSEIDKSAAPSGPGPGPEGGPGGRGGGRRTGGMPHAGGPGEGMDGPPPGGMGGGPGGPSGDGGPALPDPINFWLKIKLAAK